MLGFGFCLPAECKQVPHLDEVNRVIYLGINAVYQSFYNQTGTETHFTKSWTEFDFIIHSTDEY